MMLTALFYKLHSNYFLYLNHIFRMSMSWSNNQRDLVMWCSSVFLTIISHGFIYWSAYSFPFVEYMRGGFQAWFKYGFTSVARKANIGLQRGY